MVRLSTGLWAPDPRKPFCLCCNQIRRLPVNPGRRRLFAKVSKFWKMGIYFSENGCIMTSEQSRRPRVKCHRDGEFARRTKDSFHDEVTAPAAHIGYPPLCSNDTRSGEGFGYPLLLPFPTGQSKSVIHSLTLLALGSFWFRSAGAVICRKPLQ